MSVFVRVCCLMAYSGFISPEHWTFSQYPAPCIINGQEAAPRLSIQQTFKPRPLLVQYLITFFDFRRVHLPSGLQTEPHQIPPRPPDCHRWALTRGRYSDRGGCWRIDREQKLWVNEIIYKNFWLPLTMFFLRNKRWGKGIFSYGGLTPVNGNQL